MNIIRIKNRLSAILPLPVLKSYLKIKRAIKGDPYKNVEVKKELELSNIYHCCPQKTGSQWIKSIFSDPVMYEYTGMKPTNFNRYREANDLSKEEGRKFPVSFGENKIVTPFYASVPQFEGLPQNGGYRVFYVIRDPRDVVVSHYFSKKNIHIRKKGTDEIRRDLKNLSQEEGLVYIINHLKKVDYWKKLREWNKYNNENLLIIHYEDLIGENAAVGFKKVFDHCTINFPDEVFNELLDKYSFAKLSAGRKQGEEDKFSYYRKGVSGDWKNYFNPEITRHFKEVTGNLVVELGYENSNDWD